MALQEKLEQKMEEMNTRIKTEAESHQQTQRRLDSEVGNHTDTKALLTASLAETASLRESLQTSQQRQIDQTLEHNKLMAKNIEDAAADKLAATTLLSYTHSEAMAAASNDWQMERVKMNKQAEWLAGNNLRQLKLLEDDNQQLKAELRGICLKLVYLMVRNREEVVKKRSLLSHLSRMHGNAIYSTQHDYLLKLQDVRESCNQQLETAVRNAHEEELEAASQRIHTALKEASEAAALILSQLNDKHTAVVDGLKQDLEGVRGEVVSAREKLKLVGDKFEQSQHEYKQVVAQLTAARLAKDDLLIEKDVLVEQVKEIKRECEGMALQLGRADLDKQALEGCVQDLEEMRDNLISRAESLMREHAVGLDRVKAEAAEAAIHHHLKSSSVIGQLQTELKAAVDKFDKMTKTHAST